MHIRSKELYNEAVDSLIDLYTQYRCQLFSKQALDFLREFYENNVTQPVNISFTKNNSCLTISCRKGNRDLQVLISASDMCYILNLYQSKENIQEKGKIKNNISGVIERLSHWICQGDPITKFGGISEDNEITINKEKKV